MTDTEETSQKFTLKHQLYLSNEMLAAIGAVVVRQSGIEHALALSIELFTDLGPEKGEAVTSGMSFRSLCAALSSLVLQVVTEDDERYKEFQELMRQFQRFEEFRNQVAHSIWSSVDYETDPSYAKRYKTTARQGQGVKHHVERVEISRISSEIDSMHEAVTRLIFLRTRLCGPYRDEDLDGQSSI